MEDGASDEKVLRMGFPDAVRRDSGAPQIRDRPTFRVRNGPGSAAQHHSARKTRVNALLALGCAGTRGSSGLPLARE